MSTVPNPSPRYQAEPRASATVGCAVPLIDAIIAALEPLALGGCA